MPPPSDPALVARRPSDAAVHDGAQARSVRPLLAAARSKRGGGEQEVEASRKRPRRGAAIRASQAWTLDHSTASLVFEPLEGGACEAAVIWLHGLDDTPEPWANRLAAERRRRPHWKWIHLRCSTLEDALPVPELVSRAISKAHLAALGGTTPPGSRLGQLCGQPLPRVVARASCPTVGDPLAFDTQAGAGEGDHVLQAQGALGVGRLHRAPQALRRLARP